MNNHTSPLLPYYRNGLLYFPEKTVEALVAAGMTQSVAQAAQAGLALDDDPKMDEVRRIVQVMLAQSAPDSAVHAALSDPETQFMLTGKPAYNA